MQRAQDYLAAEGFVQSTVIGKIVAGESGEVAVCDEGGKELPIPHRGYDHFGNAGVPPPAH